MNKSFFTIAASLAITSIFLSSAPTIGDESRAAEPTATSTYTASLHTAPKERSVAPGGEASAELPSVSDWGFNSWTFFVSRIPCFPVNEVELEADVVAGEWVPVLTFTPNDGWEVVEEGLEDGILTTVYFFSEPIPEGSTYTPLFDSWSMTNFKVHSGVCGSHTYAEITAAVNSSGLERYSLQSDGISGTPEQLWSMVKP